MPCSAFYFTPLPWWRSIDRCLFYVRSSSFKLDQAFNVIHRFFQVTSHPEPVSQSMSLQQPPQPQYNIPERDKQLLFSDSEDLSASFRSLYKSVFGQSFSQPGKWTTQFYTQYSNFGAISCLGEIKFAVFGWDVFVCGHLKGSGGF